MARTHCIRGTGCRRTGGWGTAKPWTARPPTATSGGRPRRQRGSARRDGIQPTDTISYRGRGQRHGKHRNTAHVADRFSACAVRDERSRRAAPSLPARLPQAANVGRVAVAATAARRYHAVGRRHRAASRRHRRPTATTMVAKRANRRHITSAAPAQSNQVAATARVATRWPPRRPLMRVHVREQTPDAATRGVAPWVSTRWASRAEKTTNRP